MFVYFLSHPSTFCYVYPWQCCVIFVAISQLWSHALTYQAHMLLVYPWGVKQVFYSPRKSKWSQYSLQSLRTTYHSVQFEIQLCAQNASSILVNHEYDGWNYIIQFKCQIVFDSIFDPLLTCVFFWYEHACVPLVNGLQQWSREQDDGFNPSLINVILSSFLCRTNK